MKSDAEIRVELADLYARRHAPGGGWETIGDVAPRELVDIIWADVDAIIEEIIRPLLDECKAQAEAEIERVRRYFDEQAGVSATQFVRAMREKARAKKAEARVVELERELARAKSLFTTFAEPGATDA